MSPLQMPKMILSFHEGWDELIRVHPSISRMFAFLVLLTFGGVMVCYGISHAAYFSIAAGAQAAGARCVHTSQRLHCGQHLSRLLRHHRDHAGRL